MQLEPSQSPAWQPPVSLILSLIPSFAAAQYFAALDAEFSAGFVTPSGH